MFLALHPIEFLFLNSSDWLDHLAMLLTPTLARNKLLTKKFLKQGYWYRKFSKTFTIFYHQYYDLISKFNIGLKSCLCEGLSEPEIYGDFVHKLKKIAGSNNFSAQFIKIISHYKKIGYNISV